MLTKFLLFWEHRWRWLRRWSRRVRCGRLFL